MKHHRPTTWNSNPTTISHSKRPEYPHIHPSDDDYARGWNAESGAIGAVGWAHRLMGTGRWWWLELVVADEGPGGTATCSHEGHMVRVVGGAICMYSRGESLRALSSCTSFCNRRFSSARFSQHLFKNSQSISVCFNLVLQRVVHTSIIVKGLYYNQNYSF